MDSPLVLTHGGCPDGTCAAWIAWRALGREAQIVPMSYEAVKYGQFDISLLDGREVYMTDWSFDTRELMLEAAERSTSLTVLDHHAGPGGSKKAMLLALRDDGVNVEWDDHLSGATMAYYHVADRLRPSVQRVAIRSVAQLVTRRDLWDFNPNDLNDDVWNFYAAMSTVKPSPEAWDDFVMANGLRDIIRKGRTINEWRLPIIEQAATSVIPVHLGEGEYGFAANLPVQFGSDVCAMINDLGHPIAAYWSDYMDRTDRCIRKWGLRSLADGPDVATIAARFGGGGHRNASGFSTETSWFGVPQ